MQIYFLHLFFFAVHVSSEESVECANISPIPSLKKVPSAPVTKNPFLNDFEHFPEFPQAGDYGKHLTFTSYCYFSILVSIFMSFKTLIQAWMRQCQ